MCLAALSRFSTRQPLLVFVFPFCLSFFASSSVLSLVGCPLFSLASFLLLLAWFASSPLRSLFSVLCSLFSVLCSLFPVLCSLFSVLCSLFSVLSVPAFPVALFLRCLPPAVLRFCGLFVCALFSCSFFFFFCCCCSFASFFLVLCSVFSLSLPLFLRSSFFVLRSSFFFLRSSFFVLRSSFFFLVVVVASLRCLVVFLCVFGWFGLLGCCWFALLPLLLVVLGCWCFFLCPPFLCVCCCVPFFFLLLCFSFLSWFLVFCSALFVCLFVVAFDSLFCSFVVGACSAVCLWVSVSSLCFCLLLLCSSRRIVQTAKFLIFLPVPYVYFGVCFVSEIYCDRSVRFSFDLNHSNDKQP